MTKPPKAPLRRSPWRTSRATQERIEKRPLRWTDINPIADALFSKYPNTDFHIFDNHSFTLQIANLPNFKDTPHPPSGLYLDLIRAAWSDLTDTTQNSTKIKTTHRAATETDDEQSQACNA